MMYQVEIPPGIYPGAQFQTLLDGEMMLVTCPDGAGPGTMIQVAGPAISSVPTVTGIPIGPGPSPTMGAGYPGAAYLGACDCHPTVVHVQQPHVEMVEVDEISPAGWFCL